MDSLHWRIAGGIVTVIKALDLARFDKANILRQPVFDPTNLNFPGIVCSYENETEQLLGGTMKFKRVRYPVRVYLLNEDRPQPEDANWYATARHAIMQAFHQRPRTTEIVDEVLTYLPLLPGCDEVQDIQVTPLPVYELQHAIYERVVSGMKLAVECIFTRT